MTRIDFYVLQSNTTMAKHKFVCRLVDTALTKGSSLFIATINNDESIELDEKLWSYKPESYIPHDIVNAKISAEDEKKIHSPKDGVSNEPLVPVRISHKNDDFKYHDVLVNLRSQRPPQFGRFKRVIEVVNQEPKSLEFSRKNYAFYKKRGYPIHTHKMQF